MTDPMTRVDPMIRTGATWCEQHARWECSARSQRTRARCHASAIRGTARCRNHAGKSTARAKAEGEALSAWSALAAVDGRQVELVDPAAAVMGMLHMSWLRVHLYAGLLEAQVQREGLAQPAGTGHVDGDGAAAESGTSGLIGHTFAADKQAGVFASGEAVRAMAQLEAQERDRCVRFAKTAHDMGIAQRELDLAEAQTQRVAWAFGRALDALGLSVEQREEAARVLVAELRVATVGEVAG